MQNQRTTHDTGERARGGVATLKRVGVGILVLLCIGSVLFNFGLLALLGGAAGGGSEALKFREVTIEGEGPDKVALIQVKGVIGGGYGDALMGGRGTVASVIAQLRRASEDAKVKAVLLDIDSPGGGVGDSDLLYHEVRKVRDGGKPVVASLGDVAASGGYYVAAAANRIIAQPTTITGSIGVMLHSVNVEGLLQKIGVKDVTFKQGRMKDILSPTRALTPEEEKLLQGITDEVFMRFATIVAEGRKLSREQMGRIADGRILLAPEALKTGLVDAIGYRDDALAAAAKLAGLKKPQLIRYEKVFSFRDLLGGSAYAFSPSATFWNGIAEAQAPKLMYLWTLN